MDENLRGQIKNELSLRETEDLIAIWQVHDTREYVPETFIVIKEILNERLGDIQDSSTENILPRIFEKIETLIDEKKYEQGLHECEFAIRLAPKNAEALTYRGLIYDYLGQPEKAIADYRQSILLDPDFKDAQENLAELKTEISKRNEKDISVKNRDIQIDRAQEMYIRENFNTMETGELVKIWKTHDREVWTEDAFIILKEVLIDRLGSLPEITNVPPLYKLIDNIQEYREKRNFSAARIECERAVEAEPYNSEVHYLLGQTLEELGEWEKAIAAYSKAISLDSEQIDAFSRLKILEHKLEERTRNSPAMRHLNIAREYAEDEDYDLAIQEIELARTILPEVASAYTFYGEVLLKVKNTDEAIGAFEKAIQLNPEYQKARTGLRNAKVMKEQIALEANIPVDPADIVIVDQQAMDFDERDFEEHLDELEDTPNWVYQNKHVFTNEKANDYQNPQAKSELPPLETQSDLYKFEGGFISRLFTGHLRTHDPVYLLLMLGLGLILIFPIIYLWYSPENFPLEITHILIYTLMALSVPGIALIINIGMSLISKEPDSGQQDTEKFF